MSIMDPREFIEARKLEVRTKGISFKEICKKIEDEIERVNFARRMGDFDSLLSEQERQSGEWYQELRITKARKAAGFPVSIPADLHYLQAHATSAYLEVMEFYLDEIGHMGNELRPPTHSKLERTPLAKLKPLEDAADLGDLARRDDGLFEPKKNLQVLADLLPAGFLTAKVIRDYLRVPKKNKVYGDSSIADAVYRNVHQTAPIRKSRHP